MAPRIRLRSNKGISMVEVLVATLVLLPILTVVMQNFIRCMEMNEKAQQTSLAVWAERSRATAIERTPFNQIAATYNNTTFTVPGLNGAGATYVEAPDPDLLTVHLSFSWRDRRGRLTGEDVNLNGQLDAGEDTNGNGRLDSSVGFSTQICRTL